MDFELDAEQGAIVEAVDALLARHAGARRAAELALTGDYDHALDDALAAAGFTQIADGEETGLLESLEGKRGHPRLKPPFPAIVGLYGRPTVVNNVETISNLPHIIERGADWYAGIGIDEKNTGTRMYCVSGHVDALFSHLGDATHHHIFHALRIQTCAFEQCVQWNCRKVVRPHTSKGSFFSADRRTDSVDNVCLTHGILRKTTL